MVDVGELKITGSLDTGDIDRGAAKINNEMSEVKANVESSTGSFMALGVATKSVASSLARIGTVGLTAMTGLAALSPQVAPAMAMIANETRKLSFALGERLSPLFESIGNNLIPAIGTSIEKFTPQIEGMVDLGTRGISDISSVLSGEWANIESIIPKGAGVAAGIAAGAPFGLHGMLIGAALGYIAGDLIGKGNEADFNTDVVDPSTGIQLDSQKDVTTSFIKDPTSTAATVAQGTVFEDLMNLLASIFSDLNVKDLKYAGKEKA